MNWFITVLKKYAIFSGRARRKEYWMFVLFYMIFACITGIIDNALGSTCATTGGCGIITGILSLALLIPSLAVSVRRLHDIGKSGWAILLGLIPIVGWIILLVFMIKDSQEGENKYGPNPKA